MAGSAVPQPSCIELTKLQICAQSLSCTYFDVMSFLVSRPVFSCGDRGDILCQVHRTFPGLEATFVDVGLDVILVDPEEQLLVVLRVLCHKLSPDVEELAARYADLVTGTLANVNCAVRDLGWQC